LPNISKVASGNQVARRSRSFATAACFLLDYQIQEEAVIPGKHILRPDYYFAHCLFFTTAFCLIIGLTGISAAENTNPPKRGPDPGQYRRCIERALGFLQSQGQSPDGSYGTRAGVGVTALVTTAVLRCGRTADDPLAAKSLKYLEEVVQENGGIYEPGSFIANYETCVALICFHEANRDGRYNKIIRQAEAFLRGIQQGENTGKKKSDLAYGGVGYNRKSRPDLSNTTYLIDALKASGAKPDDETIQKALVFVSRCQNLESPHNTTPFAAKVNDGGFYYSCVLGRQEKERETPEGGLRSYGSMTYSGLKSMIYAGLTKDDPRVKAAEEWIRRHYDLKSNPGMGEAGLYYYYHTFAKTLDALGQDEFEDAQGVRHDWRRELAEELFRRQHEDGSWINENNRWMEGDPNLATGFALLALSYCQPGRE
jgi:squalene-hopene/tetraprenyl-beta-curcumene cyclase